MWVRLFIAGLVLAGLSFASQAQFNQCKPGFCQQRVTGGAAFVGIADAVSAAPVAYWSCTFSVSATYANGTNKLCNFRRASDGHTCDILAATNGTQGNTTGCSTGGDNGQSLSSFCNATTCAVAKFYDQSGNAQDCTQATTARQPPWAFSVVGSFGTTNTDGSTFYTCSATSAVSLGTNPAFSMAAMYDTNGSGVNQFVFENDTAGSNNIDLGGSASLCSPFVTAGGTLTSSITACGTLYSVVVATATSNIATMDVNGTQDTANVSSNTLTAGDNMNLLAFTSGVRLFQGHFGELGIWNSTFNGTNITNAKNNIHSRWGF